MMHRNTKKFAILIIKYMSNIECVYYSQLKNVSISSLISSLRCSIDKVLRSISSSFIVCNHSGMYSIIGKLAATA